MVRHFHEYFVLQIEFIDLAFNFLSAMAWPGPCRRLRNLLGSRGGLQILANCQFIQQLAEQRTS